MQHKEELISVIIPVYQTKEYLSKCVRSVLNQEYRNLEVILVDDGSTDGSGEMCDQFANNDARIKVIHSVNCGLSHARNIGIDIAKGDYISFVDSDDMLHPYFMSYLLKLCKENNADIAQCDFLMVRGEEDILPPQKVEYVHVFEPKEMLAKTYMGFESVRYIVAWNKLYRRHIFDEIRFPEGKIHEDSYTTHKLFWESKRIAISNQYLYWYLQRADSIIGKKFSIERLDSIEASRLKCKFFKDNNLIKEYYEMSVSHYNNLWRNYNLVKENIESPDEIMKKIEREAEQVKSEILSCEYGVLLDKLRTIYSHAPEKEKDIYKKMYGDRITYTSKAFFRFPFGAIKKNSQIAMFGAGGVGKSYFEQIKNGEYCELVVWVDNLWNNYVKEGYDVQPIKRLLDKEYDVILLAVQSKAVADEIAENLTSWGVDSKKIIWEYPDDRQGSREEFIKKSNNITQSQKRRIVLLNTADYGNIGDQILAEKAIEFLKKYFKQYDIIEVSGRQWDATKDIIKSKLTPEDVLLFVGGGFMGDLWTLESNRVKEIIDNFQENKKVFLPQSFFYSSDNFSYSVMQDKAFFEKYDNILYIHREDYSYRFFVDNISKMEYNLLSPDMALYAEGYETKYEREGIVSCFRMDKEKIHSNTHEIVYNYCCNNNISYRALDTLVDRSISRKNRKMEINKLLNEFCKAKLVVTDRLHGMLFCAITGTPCVALDNISKKVSGVHKWISDLEYIKVIDNEEEIEGGITELFQMEPKTFKADIVQAEFEKMASKIKDWCEL